MKILIDHPRFLWALFLFAGLSLFMTLTLQYVGEEAVYTISSLEMHYYHEVFRPMLYGTFYQRPPMLNWLMIPLAKITGWEHVLIAARLLNASATLGTAFLLVFFTNHLFQHRALAVLSGLCFFSFDILFRRGWLAYADSLFAFFTVAAIICLWIAVERRQIYLFVVAMLCLISAFLTKALTAYVFYGISALVLFIRYPQTRSFFFNPIVILLHILGFSFPLIWNFYFSQGTHGTSMIMDVVAKFQMGGGLIQYIKGLFAQPAEILLRLSPASLIAFYLVIRKRVQLPTHIIPTFITLLWIIGLNYLPYEIAPIYSMRYVLPLYPLIAIVCACLIWFSAHRYFKFTIGCFIALIILKYVAGAWWFPYYEKTYRGNYASIAKDISGHAQQYPLYANSTIAITLSVVANIDQQRFPQSPLTFPPPEWTSGFLIADKPMPEIGKTVKEYQLGAEQLYLLCKGDACAATPLH